MAEFTKEATEECGKVLLSLIANTVKLTVMNQLVPIIKDTIMQAMEDAKEEAKGGAAAESKEVEVKDRLVYDAKEKEPDLFLIHLVDTPTVYTWFGNPYTTYHMYEIRIGSDKKNNGRFYCRGLEDKIRYNHLVSLANKIKAEFKDKEDYKDKMKDFPVPPPALLHGYYCVCLSRNPNGAAHEPLVREFLNKLTHAPWAPAEAAPKFFALGDDWEQAQIARANMKQAALDTVEQFLGRPPWWYDFRDPFDESDVVRQLMCLVMDYKLIPRLRGKINPPVCRAQSLRAAEELVVTVIDAQTALWNGMQDKLNDLKGQIVKAIEEKAQEIAEKLKPIMQKVMAKLAEHQKPKAEKKAEAKDVSAKVGDFITAWQFANTEVGKKLITGLDAPEDQVLRALRHLQNDLNPRTIIENKFKEFALSLANGGFEFMAHPVVGYVIEDLARELGYTINRFNTVDAILNAAEPFFKSVDNVLQKLWDLVGKDANAVSAAIDAASAETWQGIGKSGVDLFHQYKSIRRETARKLQDAKTPEPAEDAVTGLIDEEFSMHMAALNAIRVTFLQGLRDGLTGDALGSKESIARTAHHVFRGAVIANIQIVAEEQWVKTAGVLTIYAKHMAFKKFMDVAWPAIQEVLEAVQGILPSVVAEKIKGVPEKILQKVLEIVIFKASDYAMGKLIPLIEQHLFKQE